MQRICVYIFTFLAASSVYNIAFADTEEASTGAATLTACPVCGLCPSPLGICLFLALIVAISIAIIVTAIATKGKRCPLCHNRCKKDEYMCSKCGYDFDSGLQSTMAIRVADSPELMALRGETVQLKTVDVPVPNFIPGQEEENIPPEQAEEEPEETRPCPCCGTKLPKVAMFCAKCGQRLD